MPDAPKPEKKYIPGVAPPLSAQDKKLTLTIRLHDPLEKTNAELAASWVVVKVDREALAMTVDEFAAGYVVQAIKDLAHFRPKK
jgi:hypothetical protein